MPRSCRTFATPGWGWSIPSPGSSASWAPARCDNRGCPERNPMQKLLSSLLALLALAGAAASHAAEDLDRIRAGIKKALPEVTLDSVRKTPYSGLYEVVIGGDIYYTDEKG